MNFGTRRIVNLGFSLLKKLPYRLKFRASQWWCKLPLEVKYLDSAWHVFPKSCTRQRKQLRQNQNVDPRISLKLCSKYESESPRQLRNEIPGPRFLRDFDPNEIHTTKSQAFLSESRPTTTRIKKTKHHWNQRPPDVLNVNCKPKPKLFVPI